MNRRRRALLYGLAAAVASLVAIVLVNGYSSSVAGTYGELRPVVVLSRDLAEGRVLSPKLAVAALEVRQVPKLFVPAGSLSRPEMAIGLEPVAALPAGSYLAANLSRPPERKHEKKPAVTAGRHPVELSVSGAGALTEVSGASSKVDVLVTRENRDGSGGHTFVAASGVPLLALGPPGQSDLGPDLSKVTLALTRRQALVLVEAQTFARRVTVLPGGPG